MKLLDSELLEFMGRLQALSQVFHRWHGDTDWTNELYCISGPMRRLWKWPLGRAFNEQDLVW